MCGRPPLPHEFPRLLRKAGGGAWLGALARPKARVQEYPSHTSAPLLKRRWGGSVAGGRNPSMTLSLSPKRRVP